MDIIILILQNRKLRVIELQLQGLNQLFSEYQKVLREAVQG